MDRSVIGKPGTEMEFARGKGPARVLVTGSQGYLGTVVADEISAAGYEVTGLDTGVFAECVLGRSPHDPPTLCADVGEVTATDLAGFDAVVHLAAVPDGGATRSTQRVIGAANHLASVRLARAAKAAGVSRFVFASTCDVYQPGGEAPATESSPLYPTSPWAASKLRVEEDIAALADSVFSPISLRLATVFGFSPRLRSDLPVNHMVAAAAFDHRVVVSGDADIRRPTIHVRDAADAVVRCLGARAETVHAATFNVGSHEATVTEAELARMVAEAVPGTSVGFVQRSGTEGGTRRMDYGEIRRAVGFEARRGLADGIAELLHAFVDVEAGEFHATFSRDRRQGQPADASGVGAVGAVGAVDHTEKVAS